jgi:hypothetical protein
VVGESDSSIVIKAADAIIEVQTGDITKRTSVGQDEVELSLAADANLLVSAVVSVKKGFIGSDIFGPLVPGVLADNCNCICNCGTIAETATATAASELRHPFTGGGARRDITQN